MKRSARTIVILMLGAAIAASAQRFNVAAQPAPSSPGEDLRPIYATPEDIADGKRLADLSCVGCHGVNGVSTTSGIPNLAGQRSPYLYAELKAYQSRGRVDAAMNTSVRFLSDDALVKVAAYYASLDPAEPASGAPAYFDPVEAGKTAAAACAGCHGETGVSQTPGAPSLAGLAPQYLMTAMKSYRSGQRNDDTMKSMLAAVSDADINHLALFFALQKPMRAQSPASGDQDAGRTDAAGCAGCHGETGVSSNPATPSLAGQDAQYLAAALRAYKDGARADETMKAIAASLDDNKMRNIAAYFAAQEPQAPNVRAPQTVQEWAQKCDRCHGVNGNSTGARIPALAAQRVEYLEMALRAYQTHARANPEMNAMSADLSDDDIKNLATYYSRQKARAVVFMTVPGK